MKHKNNKAKRKPKTYIYELEGSSFKEVYPFTNAEYGNDSCIFYSIEREEIEACDTKRLLHDLRPKADNPLFSAGPGTVIFSVSGYDDDPRELLQIPEFQSFAKKVQKHAPCWIYFAMPGFGWPAIIMAASASKLDYAERDGHLLLSIPPNEFSKFIKTQIKGYLKLCGMIHLDLDLIKEHLDESIEEISPGLSTAL